MIKEEDEEEAAGGGGCDHNHRRRRPQDGGFKESDELETLGSLERDLPVELSFLIRQQAFCMAKMNYLDRQIRELKENTSKQNTQTSASSTNNPSSSRLQAPSSSYQSHQHLYQQQQQQQHHHLHHLTQRANLNNLATLNGAPSSAIPMHQSNAHHLTGATPTTTTTPATTSKNGNFIPSDDSGGEYSRATISDDDELSSLLDQIAKSVKPPIIDNISNQHLQQQQVQMQMQIPIQQQALQRAQYNLIATNHHQPYAIYNPSHQHQAVPVFVMGSPIATAPHHHHHHHPSSSISSAILPGVHFQPEPRYNQYYAEDYYIQQNPLSATIMNPASGSANNNINNRHILNNNNNNSNTGLNGRSRQFDSSLSAIEQLVSQKEKRQIKSQLKSADNWLKMRASGLCSNLSDFNIASTSSISGGNGGAGETLVSTSAPVAPMSDNGQVASGGSGAGSVVDKKSRLQQAQENSNNNPPAKAPQAATSCD